jgi:hypothetical protein
VRYFGGVGLGIPPIYDNRFLKGIHYLVMQQSPNDLKSIFGYPVRQAAVSEALARNRIDMLLLIPSYTVFFLLLFADGLRENRLLKCCALIIVIGVGILDFAETGTQIEIANLLRHEKPVPQVDLIYLFYASRAKLVALGVLNIFVCILAWNNGLAHGRFRLAVLAAMFGASGTILFAFLLWKYGAHWFLACQGCLFVGWSLAFFLAFKQLGDIHISPNGKGEGQS